MVNIRILRQEDISVISTAFARAPWYKPEALYHRYLHEQHNNERCVWLAFAGTVFAGYVTLVWQSRYSSFKEQNIPEIVDLNVLLEFRNQGIGAALLAIAEAKAGERAHSVGLGEGYTLTTDQHKGYTVNEVIFLTARVLRYVKPGSNVCVDDDLVLWLVKKLV